MKELPLEFEKPRLPQYRNFATLYDVPDEQFEMFVGLYDIDELQAFMPPAPTPNERAIFKQLMGVQGEKGYMDYVKSNNTFELIMQWREQTGNYGENNLRFVPEA